MRRDPADDLAAAARRRLDELAMARDADDRDRTEIERPVGPPRALVPLVGEIPSALLRAPGRHARGPGGSRPDLLARVPLPWPIGLQRRHLGLIGAFVVVAIMLAVWLAARAAPEPMPVASTTRPADASMSAAPTTSATAAPTSGATSVAGPMAGSTVGASASPAVVVVDVAGKVRRPGVLTLPSGARVIDALTAAGGARTGVDLTPLNLARLLVDGEQILVGARAPVRPSRRSVAPEAGVPAATRINLNTAPVEALEQLPGVGPVTARKIIAWRTEHGAFSSIDELLEVDGIGPKTLARIAPGATL